jgi:hypothetical protein
MSVYVANVSEEPSASLSTLLHLKTEATGFFRILISTYQNTWRRISEGRNNFPLIFSFDSSLVLVAVMDHVKERLALFPFFLPGNL